MFWSHSLVKLSFSFVFVCVSHLFFMYNSSVWNELRFTAEQWGAPVALWLRHIPHYCNVHTLTPSGGTFVACHAPLSPHVSCHSLHCGCYIKEKSPLKKHWLKQFYIIVNCICLGIVSQKISNWIMSPWAQWNHDEYFFFFFEYYTFCSILWFYFLIYRGVLECMVVSLF